MKRISVPFFLLSAVLFALFSCSLSQPMSPGKNALSGINGNRNGMAALTSVYTGRLTGVNWFGFETGNLCPHGLWSRDYKSMLQQIKALGFNCIRLPWCDDVLTGTPTSIQINAYGVDAYNGQTNMNVDLTGLNSIQVMDKIIQYCDAIGLKVILDHHSLIHDDYMNETLWYTSSIPESTWINNWVAIVNRYITNTSVIGADLKNEPHGNLETGDKPPASWGYNIPGYGTTDWKAAAERCGSAILAANPNLKIFVEGVEECPTNNCYWWGGNLSGVASNPITVIPAKNLVYSVHEYGPEVFNQSWFSDPTFPNNMQAIWNKYFWYIQTQGIGQLYFGEFGIQESSAANPSSTEYKWFTTFMKLMGSTCSWTIWSWNPDSGDTGGILADDWVTVNTNKYNLLKPYLAGTISSSSSSSSSSVPASSSSSSVSSSVSSSSSSIPVSSSSSSSTISSSSSSVSSSGYFVNYTIVSDWGTGAQVSVTISNASGSAVSAWNLAFNFPGNQVISSIWSDGSYSQSGTNVSVSNASYNGSIPAGRTANFGFNLNYSGTDAKPASFTLNGSSCKLY